MCTHLNRAQQQQQQLHKPLNKRNKSFNGMLQAHPNKLTHFNIDLNVKPHQHQAHPIAPSQLKSLKQELDGLVRIGALSPCG